MALEGTPVLFVRPSGLPSGVYGKRQQAPDSICDTVGPVRMGQDPIWAHECPSSFSALHGRLLRGHPRQNTCPIFR